MKSLNQNKKNQDTINFIKNHPLFDKSVVMTGFRDKLLETKIIELGGHIENAITKKTFIVLVKDFEETTGKAEKARQLGIPLMTLSEFKHTYGL